MRLLRKLQVMAVAILLSASLPSARANYTAVVSANSVLSTNFQGWGSSLCWWANVVGGYSNRQAYADLAFAQLKLNIVRYNIGGGENPALTNTITNYRAIMQGFEPTNGVWDWNADANQRWMLRDAVSMGANLIDAFANSPPWWMTVSGSVTGAIDGTNNLQVADETTFAVYLATVVSNLTILDNVHFNFVTPMNEPTDAWEYDNGKQEGCHMSPAQQSRVVSDLRAQLNASAASSGIDAPEDYSEQNTVDDLAGYSSASLNSLALITTHTYSANNPGGVQSLAASLGKSLWVSEYGDGDATGLTMAQRIHDDLTGLGARAWVYWQVVDNGGGWGLLYNPLAPNSSGGFTTNYTINEKFYVMGQFSEFIRPGCNIISVNDSNTVAAYDPDTSTLTLVTVNTNSTIFDVTYDLTGFGAAFSQAAVYQTSESGSLAARPTLAVTNQQFTAVIPAESVTTFVLSGQIPRQIDAYAANLLSYGPIAYWPLNEPRGVATAYDLAGGFNGLYGSETTNGAPGIPDPPFQGISPGDSGVWMDSAGGTNGCVSTPNLGLTLTNATLLCWVYPNGDQNNSEGLVFSRGSVVDGINFGAENRLAYTWANSAATYDWDSGLSIPTNAWSFLALVITPSNAVAYVFNTNGAASNTNDVANPAEPLNAGFTIGADPQSNTLSTRVFNGEMAEVAVFNSALTSTQLSEIYSVSQSGLSMGLQHSDGGTAITWPFGALYSSPALDGPWTLVYGASSPYVITITGNQMFYKAIAAP